MTSFVVPMTTRAGPEAPPPQPSSPAYKLTGNQLAVTASRQLWKRALRDHIYIEKKTFFSRHKISAASHTIEKNTLKTNNNGNSSAGTNLKVGEGGNRRARRAGNSFLVVPLHFLVLKIQLVVLTSDFVMVSTVLSLSRLLFLYSTPRAQPFVKVGDTCPHVLWFRRH